MWLQGLSEGLERTFSGTAFAVTVVSGLLSIMVERFLFMRRGYKREAAINAYIGWTYIIGGTLLYLGVRMLKQWT